MDIWPVCLFVCFFNLKNIMLEFFDTSGTVVLQSQIIILNINIIAQMCGLNSTKKRSFVTSLSLFGAVTIKVHP